MSYQGDQIKIDTTTALDVNITGTDVSLLDVPTLVQVKTGANVVPANKLWKIKSYTIDLSVNGSYISIAPDVTASGQTPFYDPYSVPQTYNLYTVTNAGTINSVSITIENQFGGGVDNTATLKLQSIFGGDITLGSVNNSAGTSVTASFSVTRKVYKGEIFKITLSHGAGNGAPSRGSFSSIILNEPISHVDELIIPEGTSVNGSSYFVEEYTV